MPEVPTAKALERPSAPWGSRSGQSLIESCLVLILICILFFGLFQISQLLAAQEVLNYAAGRGARAKTVGFNRFMVHKTVRVGAIPNAGRMLNPAPGGGPAREHTAEAARIPLYLGADNWGQLDAILDYEAWDTVHQPQPLGLADGTVQVSLEQDVPLRYPLHHLFYAADQVKLRGEVAIDDHYPLYLDDWGW